MFKRTNSLLNQPNKLNYIKSKEIALLHGVGQESLCCVQNQNRKDLPLKTGKDEEI